jgi:integrase
LSDWLKLRGGDSGPLFYMILKSDEIVKRGIQPQAIYKMIQRRMARAGIENATPHDLRRTAISNLLELADAVLVARLSGHSSPAVTMRYDKRGEEKLIEALAKLHLPFRKEDRLVEA